MNEVARMIKATNEKGEGALIAYLMAGDPSPKKSVEYLKSLSAGGADVVEFGVPYTDPVADGQTIQAAGNRAIDETGDLASVFRIVERAKRSIETPIVLMSYYNPVFQFGEEKFLNRCDETGVDGVILPDLPVEEGNSYIELARKHSVATPFLVTPATSQARIKEVAERSTGFLYLVARPGTTGAQEEVAKLTTEAIKSVTAQLSGELPICVGFGLSSPEGISRVVEAGADGAIVGSAIVKRIAEGRRPDEVRDFVRELKSGTTR
ncbi:MAG: tryptophan synthase subunit alpha [Candidatus Acetothermia bacterium]